MFSDVHGIGHIEVIERFSMSLRFFITTVSSSFISFSPYSEYKSPKKF